MIELEGKRREEAEGSRGGVKFMWSVVLAPGPAEKLFSFMCHNVPLAPTYFSPEQGKGDCGFLEGS